MFNVLLKASLGLLHGNVVDKLLVLALYDLVGIWLIEWIVFVTL